MYLLQGVAAKERLEEQPDADIIICNVVDPEMGEILHSNVFSQGVAAKEKKENIEEQPDADIYIAMYLLQGVAAKEKEERIEEQPNADII
jgi:hypothetical protein